MWEWSFRPRKLDVENAEAYENSNLHYFVTNLERFRDRTVAICGGGDSGGRLGTCLGTNRKKVTIVHRRPQFRAQEHSVKQLEESSVEILTPYLPDQIIGDGRNIQSCCIETR